MQHWTDYWQSTNSLNSFAEGEQSSGYQNEVAEFWHSQFQHLAPDSTVVDLGTGNGAVAVLAQEYSQKENLQWNVIGLDAADIEPKKLQIKDTATKQFLNDIQFVANTPIEKAPFKSESIDAFISQFAFEYSDLEQSIQHCTACLKPGGFISILAHHPDSHISQDSLTGEEIIRYILQESPAFMQTDLLLKFAEQQTQAGQMHNWDKNPERQAITSTLHWIFPQLIQKYSSSSDKEYWCKSVIGQITSILKQIGTTPPTKLKQQLQKNFLNLDAHRNRLRDQNKACLSEERLKLIRNYCETNHLTLKVKELKIENRLFAFHLLIKK